MRLDLLKTMNAARARREPVALVTWLDSGEQALVRPGETLAEAALDADLAARFRSGRSGRVETQGGPAFIALQAPPARLVAIGAVHISQALVPMARLAGFDTIIVDPRTAFASPERFPDTALLAEWPQDALPGLGVDRFTAMAALTHDPKIDDPALLHAFEKGCFYIGALGSRKTHGARLERLRAAGADEADLARIDAPVGLDIGAASPAEIAVAVLGAVIAALRKGEAP